ncbi:hypothetical protein L0M19_26880 [Streptomyces indiaensis]|nr:hypothetical protein [Streptomyces indiaensis]MCF1648804.1 hypothetical protein [Streptomyces indiaensis]
MHVGIARPAASGGLSRIATTVPRRTIVRAILALGIPPAVPAGSLTASSRSPSR